MLSLSSAFSLVAAAPTTLAPLALAFGAGVLAVFNPCGFALLPAFVSYTLGGQVGAPVDHGEHDKADGETDGTEATPVAMRLLHGIGLGVPLTVGFLAVFLAAGGVLAVGGRALAQVFPWIGLVVGLALVGLGVRLLLPGAMIEVPLFSRLGAAVSRVSRVSAVSAVFSGARIRSSPATCCDEEEDGRDTGADGADGVYGAALSHPLRASWGFGFGYGLSSLGCTLPVFLLVVGSAIATGGLAQAALVFAAYGAGMAVVLLGVALVATSLGDVLRQNVLPLLRWVQPLSALLILAAGVYIVVYQAQTGLLIH